MIPELERDGAQRFSQALDPKDLAELQGILPTSTGPGERIYGHHSLSRWLNDGPVGTIVRALAGDNVRPVRAILFDKSLQTNWALGWRQDRTIAVRKRVKVDGFEHWNRKAGAIHVEPPFDVIERMFTFRIHIDAAVSGNAPLLIALGTHRLGRIPADRIDAVVNQCDSVACLADAGDVWVYRTPILHASDRSKDKRRRRVLQVDFSADSLPEGLEWLGVG